MAFRPTWQGHLRLSLVTCPVSLYTATNSGGEVHFNLINPETNNRIRMVTTDPDTGPVERSSLVKGYAVAKDEYILLTDEEIKSVKLESTKTIDIERFVPADEIDRLYWDNPYYLAPAGAIAEEAFGVIREAMRSEGKIALGRVVLSTRERPFGSGASRPGHSGLFPAHPRGGARHKGRVRRDSGQAAGFRHDRHRPAHHRAAGRTL